MPWRDDLGVVGISRTTSVIIKTAQGFLPKSLGHEAAPFQNVGFVGNDYPRIAHLPRHSFSIATFITLDNKI